MDKSASQVALPAWLAYAATRALWMETTYQERHPSAEYRYSFDEELEAREVCLKIWKRLKEKQAKLKDKYLDELLSVQQADFLREYVWWNYFVREWRPQPAGLELDRFKQWAAKNLKKHNLQALALAEFQDQPKPWEYDRSGDIYTHSYSHFRFPRTVAQFARGDTHVYDPMGRDVSVAYRLGKSVTMTVYVYPNSLVDQKTSTDAARSDALQKSFSDEKWEAEETHPSAKLIYEASAIVQPGGVRQVGRRAV